MPFLFDLSGFREKVKKSYTKAKKRATKWQNRHLYPLYIGYGSGTEGRRVSIPLAYSSPPGKQRRRLYRLIDAPPFPMFYGFPMPIPKATEVRSLTVPRLVCLPDVCRPPTGSTSAADADAFRSGSGRILDRVRILSLMGIYR